MRIAIHSRWASLAIIGVTLLLNLILSVATSSFHCVGQARADIKSFAIFI